MLNELKTAAGYTFTENGALTHATTGSDCLDLFATIGALRGSPEEEILSRFIRAFSENPDLAMKTLFFARDVRGGLGERRVFRVILKWLAENASASARKNVPHIGEFGRWDDLLTLMGTPCEKDALALIRKQLEEDLMSMDMGGDVSLLAKWLPSVNTSNADAVRMAKRIARSLGMNDAQYRKTLVKLRQRIRIIENNLREKDYTFDYSRQPAKAMFKYRNAFRRNDADRYQEFLSRVSRGEATLNTGTLAPYEIIAPFFSRLVSEAESLSIDTTWNAQKDFTNGENALVVIDGSGSMYGCCSPSAPRPIEVALSLGIYFAERNTGEFQNHFITFSRNPRLVEIKGETILDKVRYCASFNEIANTSVQKVFELILNTAVWNEIPQSQMPSTLYIVSDMEFDHCTRDAGLTNFQYAKALFAQAGYVLPRVVFWNVQSRNTQQPVTMNEQGVALVSGCSPRIFSMIVKDTLSPTQYMLEILGAERYEKIAA